jgi:hypothetical protein
MDVKDGLSCVWSASLYVENPVNAVKSLLLGHKKPAIKAGFLF